MKLLPRWNREAVFDGMSLENDVKLLEQGCLYRPLFHHFALGDAVVVDHEEKKVFFIQSTAQDVADQSINLSTLETVMVKLGLLSGGENGVYTLWIIFCADWSRVQTHGSCFTTTVDSLRNMQRENFRIGYDTDASVKEHVKLYKHSCVAEDGTINHDVFKLTGSKQSGHKDISQYLPPMELAILKRCHVLIVRCEYLPAQIKYQVK